MILKKLSIESVNYSTENINELKKLLKRNCEKNKQFNNDESLIENSENKN